MTHCGYDGLKRWRHEEDYINHEKGAPIIPHLFRVWRDAFKQLLRIIKGEKHA